MWCSTQEEQGCELHIVGVELNQEDKAPNCNTDRWNGMVDFLSQMTSSDASINIEFNSRTANHLRDDLYVCGIQMTSCDCYISASVYCMYGLLFTGCMRPATDVHVLYICSTQVWMNLSHHVPEYLQPIFLFDRTSIFYGIFFPLQNELLAMGYYDKVLNP